MEPASQPETAGTEATPVVRDGVVSRPALFGLLDEAGRVTEVSAPAGSGKTLMLRTWISEAGLAERAAWVSVRVGEERDPQRFWLFVLGALRGTAAGAKLVRPLTAAPGLDAWAVVERLLEDLASLDERLWLVIDDLHELRSAEALRQLELLLMRAPAHLRFVLSTRRDLGLSLHRLRLEGELTEIRAADLRLTLDEGRALLEAAGAELSAPALARLYARTEGWAAGLRLAALSLAGHPDPERFAAEFSGSERTVAEYLLAEVVPLPPAVRRPAASDRGSRYHAAAQLPAFQNRRAAPGLRDGREPHRGAAAAPAKRQQPVADAADAVSGRADCRRRAGQHGGRPAGRRGRSAPVGRAAQPAPRNCCG